MRNELDAINLILRKQGENPVPSLDIQYPTIAVAQPALDTARQEILREGFWFNTMTDIELVPDVDGVVTVPEATLMFYPNNPDYVFDGVGLSYAKTGLPVVGVSAKGRLILDKPFEDCPVTARYAIAYHAAHAVYVTDNGEDSSSQNLAAARDRFVLSLGGDHTRARQLNSRNNRLVRKWLWRLGGN